jgi:hypothetical protein
MGGIGAWPGVPEGLCEREADKIGLMAMMVV